MKDVLNNIPRESMIKALVCIAETESEPLSAAIAKTTLSLKIIRPTYGSHSVFPQGSKQWLSDISGQITKIIGDLIVDLADDSSPPIDDEARRDLRTRIQQLSVKFREISFNINKIPFDLCPVKRTITLPKDLSYEQKDL